MTRMKSARCSAELAQQNRRRKLSARLPPGSILPATARSKWGVIFFVDQTCKFYDLGGLDIADDVMIGSNARASLRRAIPWRRRSAEPATVGKPIVIEKTVWIAA